MSASPSIIHPDLRLRVPTAGDAERVEREGTWHNGRIGYDDQHTDEGDPSNRLTHDNT